MIEDLQRLEKTVEAFCRYIEKVPTTEVEGQEWGPIQVLAHLVYWHESYAAQIEAFLADRPFERPQGRFRDMNAQAARACRGIPIAVMARRFRTADERLRALYAANDPAAIVVEIKQGSKKWQLAELVPAVEAHVRNHQRQLEHDAHKNASPRKQHSIKSRRTAKASRKRSD